MRQVKGCTGLAIVVAAFAIVAIPSSAMAEGSTALCKEEVLNGCSGEQLYKAGTSVEASLKPGTQALVLTPEFTIKCGQASVAMKTLQTLATPLEAEVTLWKFSKCFLGTAECSSVVAETTGSLSLLREAAYKAIATVGMSISYKCPTTLTCKYSTPAAEFQLISPPIEEAAKLWANEQLFADETLGCLKQMKLDVMYSVTAPTPIYVST